ncbi:amidohydrolase family protein, partial [Psychrobacter sp. SIMBA_152]
IWVNSKALELANINADTSAPAGGEIIKDEFGKPTGIFIDKAETLVTQHMPATSAQSVSNALDAAGKHLLSLGITSTHD